MNYLSFERGLIYSNFKLNNDRSDILWSNNDPDNTTEYIVPKEDSDIIKEMEKYFVANNFFNKNNKDKNNIFSVLLKGEPGIGKSLLSDNLAKKFYDQKIRDNKKVCCFKLTPGDINDNTKLKDLSELILKIKKQEHNVSYIFQLEEMDEVLGKAESQKAYQTFYDMLKSNKIDTCIVGTMNMKKNVDGTDKDPFENNPAVTDRFSQVRTVKYPNKDDLTNILVSKMTNYQGKKFNSGIIKECKNVINKVFTDKEPEMSVRRLEAALEQTLISLTDENDAEGSIGSYFSKNTDKSLVSGFSKKFREILEKQISDVS